MLWGKIWKYKAHITESVQKQENITYFEYGKGMFFQDKDLKSSEFGTHFNVKIIAFIVNNDDTLDVCDASKFIYNKKVLLQLHKRYLSVLNPEVHKEKIFEEASKRVSQNSIISLSINGILICSLLETKE